MVSKTEEEARQLLGKFEEMKKLEKERDKLKEELQEMNVKVCRIQNEMNDIIESNSRKF